MSIQVTGRKIAGFAALVTLAACTEAPTAPSMEAPDEPTYSKLSDFQCKKDTWALSFTSTGASFSNQKACSAYAKSGGSISTLEILNSRLVDDDAEGLIWYLDVRGINLQPGSVITIGNGIHTFPAGDAVPENGFGLSSFGFYCGSSWGTMQAVAVLPSGATVGSNRVTSLCPEG